MVEKRILNIRTPHGNIIYGKPKESNLLTKLVQKARKGNFNHEDNEDKNYLRELLKHRPALEEYFKITPIRDGSLGALRDAYGTLPNLDRLVELERKKFEYKTMGDFAQILLGLGTGVLRRSDDIQYKKGDTAKSAIILQYRRIDCGYGMNTQRLAQANDSQIKSLGMLGRYIKDEKLRELEKATR